MASLVDFAKVAFARFYPFLVWGTLMGFSVHAGLKSQPEQVAFNEDLSARDSAHVYVDPVSVDEDSSDRVKLL